MKPSKSFDLLLIEVHEMTDNFSGVDTDFVWRGGGGGNSLPFFTLTQYRVTLSALAAFANRVTLTTYRITLKSTLAYCSYSMAKTVTKL